MSDESLLLAALEPFFQKELITDVLHVVKSGKEATVYCCQAHPSTGHELLAAKIYRPRQNRSFKNDAIYQEGRMLDARLQRAAKKRSEKGIAAQFALWIDAEYETLHRLYAAGASLPRPFMQLGTAMLMEYIGDRTTAAPLLAHVRLQDDAVRPLFNRLLHNIELWLACDRVHGDLSPFNILYWQGDVTVIDFPQAVHPQVNPNAFALLQRDVDNVCGYFARYGIRSHPRRIVEDMWTRYQFGEL